MKREIATFFPLVIVDNERPWFFTLHVGEDHPHFEYFGPSLAEYRDLSGRQKFLTILQAEKLTPSVMPEMSVMPGEADTMEWEIAQVVGEPLWGQVYWSWATMSYHAGLFVGECETPIHTLERDEQDMLALRDEAEDIFAEIAKFL